jgi:hypothetical protein
MKTLSQLVNAAQNKGIEFQTFTNRFKNIKGFLMDGTNKTFFGFKYKNNYFWFEGYSDESDDILFFSEKYFTKSGLSYKTYKTEKEALKILGL